MISDYEQMVCYHYSLTDYQLCLKIDPKFFTFGGGKLAKCFELAKEYLTKYKTAPSEQDVVDMAKMRNLDDQLTENFIHTVYLSKDSYKESDPKWLYDRTTSWAKWQNTISHVIDTATYLRQVEDHLTLDSIDEKLERARSMLNTGLVLDFSDSENKGKHLWCAADHKQEKMKRRSTGYSFIDFCLGGGYWDGSLVVFVGQPKVGKSNFLCNLAAKSVTSGYNVAYISCELPEEMILSRIGANMFGIPIASYDETAADEMGMSKRISQFRSRSVVQPGELYVKSYGTSTLTTVMLESDLLAEEERMSMELGRPFHFDVVYIDYINIMSNWRNPNTENTYMKIKQLAEDVKAVGIAHNWAMVTATQTNRAQADSNDMSVSDVAESHALLATVDCMFGICADPIMRSQGTYFLKCLADRVSPQENKRKKFDIDKQFLRITEDLNSPIIEVGTAIDGVIANSREKRSQGRSLGNVPNVTSTVPTITPVGQQAQQEQVKPIGVQDIVGDLKDDTDGHDVNPALHRPMSIFDTSTYNGGKMGGVFANRNGL